MAGKNNVIKRESLPNKAEDGGQDEEDDKSVIRISVDLSNVYEDIYDSDELPEEKYSDVMNRDDIPNRMEDAEEFR
ncbi:hypothetical protein HOLleu_25035 [Holothuria leucospilota]|uniref:Uncharacterized protein n=1 Tax=Holothuria leucospilota TaxID=206669 RepID=A0A9Q1BS34_HOLLE|nr:hypothetical protein HOLleu_25035 [Holothuria leucospilota]